VKFDEKKILIQLLCIKNKREDNKLLVNFEEYNLHVQNNIKINIGSINLVIDIIPLVY
jgi:hypothetical protein